MSNKGSQIIKILQGELESESFELPWESNVGIAYIATQNTILANTNLEMHIKSKVNTDVWLPFFNPTKNINAVITLIQNKIIPISPYVDGRGAGAVKFKLNQIQTNDVVLEIGLVKII